MDPGDSWTTPMAADVDDRLGAAIDVLDLEGRRTADERDALVDFADRVEDVDPDRPPAGAGGGDVVSTVGARPRGRGLLAVRTAYRETVMSVPHYEAEYDDTYAESVHAEFDPGLAGVLTDGPAFGARCKSVLLAATADARDRRQALLEAVEDERASVAWIADELRSVAGELDRLAEAASDAESFGALDGYRARLDALEERCRSVLADRQAELFEGRRRAWLPSDEPDLATYLYRDLPVDYPVMSTVAALLDRIGSVRSEVERAMATCRV